MRAPHLARAHHRRGAGHQQAAAGKFTQADLELLLTLVEPCAIAIENAILFQRTEQLTITDDLTKLFNSRYLNLYIGREIKRCKRHGIPLSVIFLDLDGFKSVNDAVRPPGGLAHPHRGGRHPGGGGARVGHPGPLRRRRVRGGAAGDARPRAPWSSPSASAAPSRATSSCRTQGLEARISASFGIASYPDHALTPEGLIQKADQAMYRVKERDKNGIEVAV